MYEHTTCCVLYGRKGNGNIIINNEPRDEGIFEKEKTVYLRNKIRLCLRRCRERLSGCQCKKTPGKKYTNKIYRSVTIFLPVVNGNTFTGDDNTVWYWRWIRERDGSVFAAVVQLRRSLLLWVDVEKTRISRPDYPAPTIVCSRHDSLATQKTRSADIRFTLFV